MTEEQKSGLTEILRKIEKRRSGQLTASMSPAEIALSDLATTRDDVHQYFAGKDCMELLQAYKKLGISDADFKIFLQENAIVIGENTPPEIPMGPPMRFT